ncbi:MAG: Crp/Fnr family transcriptional regulator [Pseudomonadota bacterium]|nr:Crp/Fnr family transcriptional regulator [Pseudomonadota bacterium]
MKADLHHHPLIRHLRSTTDIGEDDVRLLLDLPMTEKKVGRGHEIFGEGEHLTRCCLILQGYAARYRVLRNGSRQIVAFNVPGDVPDLQSLHLKTMDHSLITLDPTRLALIPHDAMRELIRRNDGVADALWRRTLIDGAILREWVTGLGRKPAQAQARIAHILCELMARISIIEVDDQSEISLPITQNELGDALGLSYVHVNRILQDFSRDGTLDFRRKMLTIHKWDRLQNIAEFDPSYLHFTQPPESVLLSLSAFSSRVSGPASSDVRPTSG